MTEAERKYQLIGQALRKRKRGHKLDTAWYQAHPAQTQKAWTPPDAIKRMDAHNEFVSGSCTWHRRDGLWTCVSSDGVLTFLLSKDPISAKFELLKRGFTWQWIDSNQPGITAGELDPERQTTSQQQLEHSGIVH